MVPASWPRCSTRKPPACRVRRYLLAAGDNVGASPANSGLLQDRPAIEVENAWGMDATSYGNDEFDYGVERLLMHQDLADFPFLAMNIVEDGDRRDARLGDAVRRADHQRRQGRRHRLGREDDAGTGLGERDRRARFPRRGAAHRGRVRAAAAGKGVRVQVLAHPRGDRERRPIRSASPRACRGTARSSTSSRTSRGRRSTPSSPAIRTA